MMQTRPEADAAGAVVLREMAATDADLALFRACFGNNGNPPRSAEALRWQYLQNVTGELFVDLALADDGRRVAAIYATLPGFMRIDGQKRRVLQSLDTLTDAAFRGKGLFVSLAQKTFVRAAASGMALVYGFPNANSAHGFFKKLAWTSLDPVPFLIRPLRTRYFAERMPKKLRAAAAMLPDVRLPAVAVPLPRGARVIDVDAWDERVTDLWNAFARGVGVSVERDARYLQWRLGDKPNEHYRTIALENNGRYDALCTYTTKIKHGGRIGYVMELLHCNGQRRAAAGLLARAVRAMAEDGADAALAWCFRHSPNYLPHVANGFVPMPERLRPIELHMGVRAFDPALARILGERSQWYVSYLDSDTV